MRLALLPLRLRSLPAPFPLPSRFFFDYFCKKILHISKKSSTFAAKSCKDMQNSTEIYSLESTLSSFFDCVTKHQPSTAVTPFLQTMTCIFNGQTSESVVTFALDDDSTAKVIAQLKEHLQLSIPEVLKLLNMPLTYLLDELICNIQQHAQTDKGYVYLMYNEAAKTIEIVIADFGITIYGSYVAAQKHLDKLGDSDAEALNLAQNGYSVKNLPNTENRGYGISSNMKMVVDGLHGEFAVLSGNALMLQAANNRKILALPSEIDFKGTMIMVRIPAQVPDGFNLYDYMS